MNDQELALWLRRHGGEVGRKNNERREQSHDDYGRTVGDPRTTIDSTTITAADGATLTLRRNGVGTNDENPYEKVGEEPPDPSKRDARTPEQTRIDVATASGKEAENAQKQREAKEIEYNGRTPDEFGEMVPETIAERAARVQKKRLDQQQAQVQAQTIESSKAATEAARARITQDQNQLASQEREGAAGRALTARQIELQAARDERDANKPSYLSQADDKSPNIVIGKPDGSISTVANPNYDAVKAAAEEKRKDLALEISAGNLNLEEAKQAYSQWFDTDVKTPLMLAQEARAKAEERRQALEAEERRKQFAANYGLQKATLGQQAGQAAVQNEISLLPYRAGPTWGQDSADAINGLAAGGKINGPDASAGVHFSDSSFAFDRPDFKSIAKKAASAALSGLTDYRPSDEQFATGDYSGVPAVNLSGMPTYQFQPVSLPAPSPGAAQPAQ